MSSGVPRLWLGNIKEVSSALYEIRMPALIRYVWQSAGFTWFNAIVRAVLFIKPLIWKDLASEEREVQPPLNYDKLHNYASAVMNLFICLGACSLLY